MSAAIALEKPLMIAYLGPEASNTHAAALKKFGASVDYHGMATVSDIFTAVEKAKPTTPSSRSKNSTEGSVREHSIVSSRATKIVAQPSGDQPCTHLQLALEDIERVYSEVIRRLPSVGIGCNAICHMRSWSILRAHHARCSWRNRNPEQRQSRANSLQEHYGVPIVERNIRTRPITRRGSLSLVRKASGPVGGGKDISSFAISLGDQAASAFRRIAENADADGGTRHQPRRLSPAPAKKGLGLLLH